MPDNDIRTQPHVTMLTHLITLTGDAGDPVAVAPDSIILLRRALQDPHRYDEPQQTCVLIRTGGPHLPTKLLVRETVAEIQALIREFNLARAGAPIPFPEPCADEEARDA
jgi:hypothetical protein